MARMAGVHPGGDSATIRPRRRILVAPFRHRLHPASTVPIKLPTLSEPLRRQIAALADDPSLIVERVYASLTQLECYRTLAPAVRDDIFQSLARTVEDCFRLLTASVPADDDVTSRIKDFAHRRVHQQVPLQSLLRAFQIGAREVLRTCTELAHADRTLTDALLFGVLPYLFDYFDAMAQVITEAYLAEQYEQARWRDSILHQLHTVVFHAPDDQDSFAAAVRALGLDPALPRIALAIDATLGTLPPDLRDAEAERLALGVARHFRVAPDQLVHVWHRDRVIVWVPCRGGETISRRDRTAHECAAKLADAEPGIRLLGIGLMNQAAHGWAASAAEAIRATECAPRGATAHKVFGYASIALEESVRGTANVLRYLESLLEALGNEPDLLATLSTYFAQGRRRATAEALGIHPNTLDYRLERIESMIGASLDDAGWIARLTIALRLRQHGLPQG